MRTWGSSAGGVYAGDTDLDSQRLVSRFMHDAEVPAGALAVNRDIPPSNSLPSTPRMVQCHSKISVWTVSSEFIADLLICSCMKRAESTECLLAEPPLMMRRSESNDMTHLQRRSDKVPLGRVRQLVRLLHDPLDCCRAKIDLGSGRACGGHLCQYGTGKRSYS